jgi:STE24 endopeptidase
MQNANSLPAHWLEHDKKVRPYVLAHRLLSLAESAVGLAFLAVLVVRGKTLSDTMVADSNAYVAVLKYFGLVALAWEGIAFPFSFVNYSIERRFGLSRQSVGGWAADFLKGLGLKFVLGAIALCAVRACIAGFGDKWWLATATAFFLFSIALAQLAPVLLIPIFFKMKPMEDGPLKRRLFELCAQFKVKVSEVYHLGLGEKTEKGNAAFMGLGGTKRIVIGDTLYEKYAPEEVEAVFAHELGHQVHNDLWKGIALSTTLLYLTFFAAEKIGLAWIDPWAGSTPETPHGMILFFAILSFVNVPLGTLQAAFSRARERAADAFALNKAGLAGSLASALEKLTVQNW